MGIATGCMGMSISDFCSCAPSEFNAIHECYRDARQEIMRQHWEQTRFMSVAILQPYSKKKLKASDLVLFPWEKKQLPEEEETSTQDRFEELMKKWNK